jgi:non-ribosomal peptide synthase protein (TIGR01720 family)
VHDNFFELGGDSILGIQIVARAREAGLGITPRQIFQHQTIAELAAAAGAVGSVDAEQGAITGPAPLTPIQRWWLAQDAVDPHHHNQSFLLEPSEAIDPAALGAALAAVIEHHDALRARFARDASGPRSWIAPPGGPPPLSVVDLSSLSGAAQRSGLEAAAAAAQGSLDLAAGPIVRAVLFDLGEGRQRLLLVVHHLAVDAVSWRILLEDLGGAHRRARRGEAIALPPKTTSFRSWGEKLAAHARSDALRAEEPFWLAEARRHEAGGPPVHDGGSAGSARSSDSAPNPTGSTDNGLEGATRAVTVELDPRETGQLLREVPEAYRTQINDVLLTALAEALAPWMGSRQVRVHLEGHGREEIFPDADVTRTVGWFTTLFPVVLDLGAEAGPGAALTRIKEQLRAVPGRGIGYGLLRWLREDEIVGRRLAEAPAAAISFNYTGQIDQAFADAPFYIAPESPGVMYSPRALRAHALDVQAGVRGGRLRVRLASAEGRFAPGAVEALADGFLGRLRALIAHCLSPEAGGYTPSDFSKAGLDEAGIGAVLDQLGDEE